MVHNPPNNFTIVPISTKSRNSQKGHARNVTPGQECNQNDFVIANHLRNCVQSLWWAFRSTEPDGPEAFPSSFLWWVRLQALYVLRTFYAVACMPHTLQCSFHITASLIRSSNMDQWINAFLKRTAKQKKHLFGDQETVFTCTYKTKVDIIIKMEARIMRSPAYTRAADFQWFAPLGPHKRRLLRYAAWALEYTLEHLYM